MDNFSRELHYFLRPTQKLTCYILLVRCSLSVWLTIKLVLALDPTREYFPFINEWKTQTNWVGLKVWGKGWTFLFNLKTIKFVFVGLACFSASKQSVIFIVRIVSYKLFILQVIVETGLTSVHKFQDSCQNFSPCALVAHSKPSYMLKLIIDLTRSLPAE
jgi:hypothetical protein